MREGITDVVVLPVVSAGRYLARDDREKQYEPVMLVPGGMHRVQSIKKEADLEGVYLTVEHPLGSTGSTYRDDLKDAGLLSQSRCSREECDTDQCLARIADGDEELRIVSWFPHCTINEVVMGLHNVDSAIGTYDRYPSILFAKNNLTGNHVELYRFQSLIYDAWLQFRENSDLCRRWVKSLLQDDRYVRYLTRTSGVSFTGNTLTWC